MEAILDRLYRFRTDQSPNDVKSTKRSIQNFLNDGWNGDEIFNYLRWSEEVNPDVSEESALAKMRVATKKVKERFAAEGKPWPYISKP